MIHCYETTLQLLNPYCHEAFNGMGHSDRNNIAKQHIHYEFNNVKSLRTKYKLWYLYAGGFMGIGAYLLFFPPNFQHNWKTIFFSFFCVCGLVGGSNVKGRDGIQWGSGRLTSPNPKGRDTEASVPDSKGRNKSL